MEWIGWMWVLLLGCGATLAGITEMCGTSLYDDISKGFVLLLVGSGLLYIAWLYAPFTLEFALK